MLRRLFFLASMLSLVFSGLIQAKVPDLTPQKVNAKIKEVMSAHVTQKQLSPTIVKRTLQNFVEGIDPLKTYFIATDVDPYVNPSDAFVLAEQRRMQNSDYSTYEKIYSLMLNTALPRRHRLNEEIDDSNLPKDVKASEFKDTKWVENEQELLERLKRIKALQLETASKLSGDLKEKSLQWINKRQAKVEEKLNLSDPQERQKQILVYVLKAVANALDAHTTYFTPEEASQFVIEVQKRLFGIGAQLRDDLNGLTVIKVVEGGPAAKGGELKAKDRIVAVDSTPIVGMDITDAVELIRGEENTPVHLTVIREEGEGEDKKEKQLKITIMRGEVVFKDMRYEVAYEPFGNGVIGYVRLFSFYQDPDSSSSSDITQVVDKLKKEHKLEGLILDLRSNTGGVLSQAVAVTGLFITKGIVVSIMDDEGQVQHLRDLDGKTIFDGPLIILVNRSSASASEIVAQTLQDYGRALIVGDDHTFGKGSFQTFTLNAAQQSAIDPEGEYKVTRGLYYTVSGKTPQLHGVIADIVVPGIFSESEIGEKYAKYPLENKSIKENFDDDLSDIPFFQRNKIRLLYKFNLQPKLTTYNKYLDTLRKNSTYRIERNKDYQNMLKEIKKKDKEIVEEEVTDTFGQNDLQLDETISLMKDLILLQDFAPRSR